MQYFLGVDGGQSSTTALIGDASGHVLGMGRGGPCNHVSGEEARARFTSAIGGCVAQARAAAGLATDVAFEAACFGFSGSPTCLLYTSPARPCRWGCPRIRNTRPRKPRR